jgi:tyrosine-protein kinase Etk/Wzc
MVKWMAHRVEMNIFPAGETFKNQQNLKNEIGILKSFDLNNRVIEVLPEFHIEHVGVGKRGLVEKRMYMRSPFIVVYDSLEKQDMANKVEIQIISGERYNLHLNGDKNFNKELQFGEKFAEMGYNFSIKLRNPENFKFNPDASNRYYFRFQNPASLANRYRRKLSVTPIEEEATLVSLQTSGFVSEQEIDYLNMLMKVYINDGLAYKNKTSAQTLKFIEAQLKSISDSLSNDEDSLESFRLKNRLIDISREGEIIQNKLEQIDAERTSLLLQKNYYEYLKNYIDSKTETVDIVAPSVMGISDQLLIRLVDELSQLQRQKKQLAMNLYESSQPLMYAETNIVSARNALSENISNGLLTIENSLNNIEVRLKDVDNEIMKLPSTEKQMINIQRKFDINNSVYTFLLEKRAEAGITQASNVPDNRIIDYAGFYNVSRIKPKERQNLMMALILGLFFPVTGILLIDFLNTRIIDKKDIERITRTPIIGFISHNTMKSEIPVVEKPGSTMAESFRSVRTNLKYLIKDIPNPVIAVSSAITAEGKTFVSANLAAILASLGKKVLLVGLDLRKPRIHNILGLSNENGVSQYLIGETDLESILIETDIENLWYSPAGPIPPNPAELIESETMQQFIEEVKTRFDYIIIDTPPIAIVTDALLLSSLADIYFFVVRQRYSSKETIGLIDELYRHDNIRKIGIIMNDISLTGYYGYGLRYGYSGGYGYSYGYNYYGDYVSSRYGYGNSGTEYYTDNTNSKT